MSLLHTFSLAPCSRFSATDCIWRYVEELETIAVHDDAFVAMQPEIDLIPVDGGRLGIDQATSNLVTPQDAVIAEKQFEMLARRHDAADLIVLCKQLASMCREAREENCFVYHCGL